ncbi:hypothetical protein BN85411500 [Alteracholeplasma palmae J233]|uniref:CAAX prenyl protease 2/Lysostaphin resistance protein A-like domain-containing protein n=1 Tax=Alteracholeplasma palmae (strain ATCC 49389 / J233) TaxID=1318466 RepID=U4KLJ4_ALTPJ|nr:type II CAAX endopeptidase family protein [Alteracholeplasma palmae]CCV64727.1 hypothetical protein BN85411500 [Alteracholeplasma palmae J233]
MNLKVNKRIILITLLMLVFSIGFMISWQLLLTDNLDTYSYIEVLGEFLSFCIAAIFAFFLFEKVHTFFRIKGIKKGLLIAFPIYILIAALLIKSLVGLSISDIEYQGVDATFRYILFMICVGLFEELLFRGILLNVFIKVFENKENKELKALMVSSLLFGMVHFLNILGGQHYLVTIGQVIYTISLGLIFGLIYLKSGNLIAAIIAHVMLNIVAMFTVLIYPTTQIADVSFMSNLINALISIGISVPMYLSSYWIYKKYISNHKGI